VGGERRGVASKVPRRKKRRGKNFAKDQEEARSHQFGSSINGYGESVKHGGGNLYEKGRPCPKLTSGEGGRAVRQGR